MRWFGQRRRGDIENAGSLILRFEVLTAINVFMLVFWVAIPRGPVVRCQRFGRTFCFHLQPRRPTSQILSYIYVDLLRHLARFVLMPGSSANSKASLSHFRILLCSCTSALHRKLENSANNISSFTSTSGWNSLCVPRFMDENAHVNYN